MRVVALLAILTCASVAEAQTRQVAVVEFRAGSTAIPEIGARISRMLTVKTGLGVMAPEAARQEFGASLDAEVKGCSGELVCVAKLGQRLGVDEVLLVSVSELGDVIVTMQRIIVESGEARGSMAETLRPGHKPTDAELEGFLRQVFPAADFEQYGSIRIESNVSAASVSIGGTKRGVTPLAPITVPAPGNYDVAVRKSGYSDFRANIAVTPNANVLVKPELTRLPSDVWYKKWWVLAIAGAVTVGAVSTAIVLSSDGPSDVPVMVDPF